MNKQTNKHTHRQTHTHISVELVVYTLTGVRYTNNTPCRLSILHPY